jgi:transposase InsO family protein
LIKGQVINDKNKDTIIKGIEKKWIIGDGAGPGHSSRGFFTDTGGEFLNENMIDFASTLNITIKMTAASSPWMNGSCERAHATVDRLVEKILEDDPKVDLQRAVDLACFVKNSEINQTGFSPIQLFTGRSPTFPGLSDCYPASVDLEGSNEYIKVLRRMDHARVEARKIDCSQRLKTALK